MDHTNTILTDIRERIVRVETKLDVMTDAEKTADNAEKIANEALSSSKSAHHRLDKVDKIIFWAATTIIGSVLFALFALVYNTK